MQTCVEREDTGALCTSDGECDAFTCEPTGSCAPTDLPEASPGESFSCASDACEGGVCVAAACSPDVA